MQMSYEDVLYASCVLHLNTFPLAQSQPLLAFASARGAALFFLTKAEILFLVYMAFGVIYCYCTEVLLPP